MVGGDLESVVVVVAQPPSVEIDGLTAGVVELYPLTDRVADELRVDVHFVDDHTEVWVLSAIIRGTWRSSIATPELRPADAPRSVDQRDRCAVRARFDVGLPADFVDLLAELVAEDDAVGVVAQHEAAAVGIVDVNATVPAFVSVAAEHDVAIRRNDETALDRVTVRRSVRQRPTGELDAIRCGVVQLEPLAVAVADRGGVAHHLADDDRRRGQRARAVVGGAG